MNDKATRKRLIFCDRLLSFLLMHSIFPYLRATVSSTFPSYPRLSLSSFIERLYSDSSDEESDISKEVECIASRLNGMKELDCKNLCITGGCGNCIFY